MNPNINKLQAYPFEKLAQLKKNIKAPAHLEHIALSIGEPKHQPPEFVLQVLRKHLHEISKYPSTKGSDELRQSISSWLMKRFQLKAVDFNSQILPVNGTREALFAFAQALFNPHDANKTRILMPNPFYQIYEGAAYLAGAEPYFLNTNAQHHFIPDYHSVAESVWQSCQLLYLCSPGNPSGSVTSIEQFQYLISLADKYNFVIASDECYSELYPDENNPPPGLLQACAQMGRDDFARCMVFHSLSKRSNLPGLRSGFVAGDDKLIKDFLQYRTYHGCAMSLPTQLASVAAWSDEKHVQENRTCYRQKFNRVYELLKPHYDIQLPDAGFYFWLKTPIDDLTFSAKLFEQQNITVLPGQFLSRLAHGVNPGENFVRMALVAEFNECEAAALRLVEFKKEPGCIQKMAW